MIYIFSGIILYIFSALILFLLQRRILFNTSGRPKKPEYYGLKNIREIKIPSDDNVSLLSWYFEGNKDKPILIYFHGNSFDIGERAYRVEKYISLNYSVLLVSWRGFSGNNGKPSEDNLYIDGESAIKWVLNSTNKKLKDIVIYGESLGTGVAIQLATKSDFACIVLEAPFTSIVDIAKKRYRLFPVRLLVKDKFDNFSKINKINSPLLIISGKKDEIVPHSHSRILFNEAKVNKKSVFVDEAMHNNLYDFGIEKEVNKFVLSVWK